MDKKKLDNLHDRLADHLERIKRLFKPEYDAKLTLVVRMPGVPEDEDDAWIVISDDNLDEALAGIQRRIDEAQRERMEAGHG